mmetsp:Transcript_18462/g.58314  ORF Transcript_18462/g.58314 Transcript_18462/m.58314 type:complete len:248 (+) Transcript_18462:922-1665(+)
MAVGLGRDSLCSELLPERPGRPPWFQTSCRARCRRGRGPRRRGGRRARAAWRCQRARRERPARSKARRPRRAQPWKQIARPRHSNLAPCRRHRQGRGAARVSPRRRVRPPPSPRARRRAGPLSPGRRRRGRGRRGAGWWAWPGGHRTRRTLRRRPGGLRLEACGAGTHPDQLQGAAGGAGRGGGWPPAAAGRRRGPLRVESRPAHRACRARRGTVASHAVRVALLWARPLRQGPQPRRPGERPRARP